jgi:hypothetical protein
MCFIISFRATKNFELITESEKMINEAIRAEKESKRQHKIALELVDKAIKALSDGE